MSKKKKDKLQIRNSTAEFLMFTSQAGDDSIEVRVADETVWLTQKLMAQLFDVTVPTVNEHLKNIFKAEELNDNSVIRKFLITASDGKNYNTNFYSLDAIISVGYRVNSVKATQFRQWATRILHDYATRGYVLDKERLKNGAYLNEEYYDHLLEEIREIRASERRFYQKITDIYTTAMDYNKDDVVTKDFFAIVQNKLHYAAHQNTAAELIKGRPDSEKLHMGLTSWKNTPDGKIIKSDVSIAKNYLSEQEFSILNRFVTMYLDYAEMQAERRTPICRTGLHALMLSCSSTKRKYCKTQVKSARQWQKHLRKVSSRNTVSPRIVCSNLISTEC
jgi:hypothetical protein